MSDAYARRLEAVLAGHRGDAAAAEGLLGDDSPSARVAALGALARCGALTTAHISAALHDAAAQVRCRAAELAPPDVPLVHLLADPDDSVVEAAAAALGERDTDATGVDELCRVAVSHDDALCRESAIAALGAIAAGIDIDDAGYSHSASTQRAPATQQTQQTQSVQQTPTTQQTASTDEMASPPDEMAADIGDEARTRNEAARTMALDVLLAAMADRPQIRRRALLGLHQFADERAEAAVQTALDDNDRQVRAVAGELLRVPVR